MADWFISGKISAKEYLVQGSFSTILGMLIQKEVEAEKMYKPLRPPMAQSYGHFATADF